MGKMNFVERAEELDGSLQVNKECERSAKTVLVVSKKAERFYNFTWRQRPIRILSFKCTKVRKSVPSERTLSLFEAMDGDVWTQNRGRVYSG